MTNSTFSDMPDEGDYAGRSHAQYRLARIHSRRVRMLKILLPLSAALVVVVFVALSWIKGLVPEGVEIESVVIRDGKLVMQNPVMSGQSSNDRSYTMRALRAVQDLANPDVVELEDIVADLPVADDDMAILKAQSGDYDRNAQRLVFKQPFTVTTKAGMKAELQSADIDLAAGGLVTNQPVSIRSPDASVVAQSMEMQDKGAVIIFHDKVRMTINPSALKSKDGAKN